MPTRLRLVRSLALVPVLAVIVGPFFVNRVTPLVFGMPFLLAWLVIWIVATPVIMAVIFRLDPANASERE
jgi:tellurite resistance protein TehA-like permease